MSPSIRDQGLFLVTVLALSGCYPRVNLTRDEKARMPMHGRSEHVVMCTGSGQVDTVSFQRLDRRYEAHFDVLYESAMHRRKGYERRMHLLSYASIPGVRSKEDFPPYIVVNFTKLSAESTLRLSVDGFLEEYDLSIHPSDTVVFETHDRIPSADCYSCVKCITWDIRTGLLSIERIDGQVWRRYRSNIVPSNTGL